MASGWLPLILALSLAAALAGALLSALLWWAWGGRLSAIAPGARASLLAALVLLPVAAAVGAPTLVFAPSLLDMLGLVADHCAHHRGHAFHLCFVHGRPPAISALAWVVAIGAGVVALGGLSTAWGGSAVKLLRARRWRQCVAKLSNYDEGLKCWVLSSERPVAVAVGLLRPRIFVTAGMRAILEPRHFAAVVAHERAHVRRRDALLKALVRLGAPWQLPGVRQRLLEELDLACEQACDEEAAAAVGDRLTVAEAILAVERHSGSAGQWAPVPELAVAFDAGALERRVAALVGGSWTTPRCRSAAALVVAACVGLGAGYDVLHHTAETLLLRLIHL